jgi:hypothetical protein
MPYLFGTDDDCRPVLVAGSWLFLVLVVPLTGTCQVLSWLVVGDAVEDACTGFSTIIELISSISVSLPLLSSDNEFSKSVSVQSQKYIFEYCISKSFLYSDSTNGTLLFGKFFTIDKSWYNITYL